MKKLFLIAILSVGIISGVVLSPEIWAIIEPHVTITMDPGQTTKPFQILDNLGDEVFSVDVDGTIFPDQSTALSQNLQDFDDGYITLHYEQFAEISTNPVGTSDINDYEQLATWEITFTDTDAPANSGGRELPRMAGLDGYTSGFMKSSSGDQGEMRVQTSEDGGITWTDWFGVTDSVSGNTYNSNWTDLSNNDFANGDCDRAIANDDGRTCQISVMWGSFGQGGGVTIEAKEIKVVMKIVIPSGATIERIL